MSTGPGAGAKLSVPRGFVSGTAVVRDKFGNVKGELVFSGETGLTAEEFKEQLRGKDHGRDLDDSGA